MYWKITTSKINKSKTFKIVHFGQIWAAIDDLFSFENLANLQKNLMPRNITSHKPWHRFSWHDGPVRDRTHTVPRPFLQESTGRHLLVDSGTALSCTALGLTCGRHWSLLWPEMTLEFLPVWEPVIITIYNTNICTAWP